tara:strand:+ start:237 stop:2348 length:2112 start_codon:yes stop_codon:yes gene_type:complete
MIDLERNKNGDPIPAKGERSKVSSIYIPNQLGDFKISRTRFSDFLTCPRCFYLDRVAGLKQPGIPNFSLNITTDQLLKKEFDECREKQIPHRLFLKYGLDNVVPFQHPDIDLWRNSLSGGLQCRYKKSNIILTGGIDDIWLDRSTNALIIVDYKSQAKKGVVEQIEYLKDPYHEGYKIQMDFYAYLLINMGFKVKRTSYFLVCNANKSANGFYGNMGFDEYLVPYKCDVNWIENKIDEMIMLINQHKVPTPNKCCNNCAYANKYSEILGNHRPLNDENINDLLKNNQLSKTFDENNSLKNDLLNLKNEKKILERTLFDPTLLTEHISNYFGDNDRFLKNLLGTKKDNYENYFPSVISPVIICAAKGCNELFGVIVSREKNIYMVLTNWEFTDMVEEYDDIKIKTLIDCKEHIIDDWEIVEDFKGNPNLIGIYFKSNENYIFSVDDYLKLNADSSFIDHYKRFLFKNKKGNLKIKNTKYPIDNNQLRPQIILKTIMEKCLSSCVLIKSEEGDLLDFGILIKRTIDTYIGLTSIRSYENIFKLNENSNKHFYIQRMLDNKKTKIDYFDFLEEGFSDKKGFGCFGNGFSKMKYLTQNSSKNRPSYEVMDKYLSTLVRILFGGGKEVLGLIIDKTDETYTTITHLDCVMLFINNGISHVSIRTMLDGCIHSIDIDYLIQKTYLCNHKSFAVFRFKSTNNYPVATFIN